MNATSTLSKALEDAVEDETLDRNVARGVWRVKAGDRQRGRAWSEEEIRAFLSEVEEDRLVGLWRLLLTTGCRRGEALGLDWRHLDLDQNVVLFEQAYVPGLSGYVLQPTKTGRVRRARLEPGTRTALVRLYQSTVEDCIAGDRTLTALPDSPVFQSLQGRRLNPDGISKRWRDLCVKANVPGLRLHDARHSAATALLNRGVPVHQVSALLGHSTPTTTHSTYAHVVNALDPTVVIAMEQIVGKNA